ncbi:MAG: helix-turn-helix domain-containing protein [Planctomycetes bacterium]|nr:helix-turn-helix domain-containing protein [Planctomycetota bacterium]
MSKLLHTTLPSQATQNIQKSSTLALTAREAAFLLNISVRHWHSMVASGRTPAPTKLGRCTRWAREEFEEWIRVGCPAHARWEALKSQRRRGA